MSQTWQPPKDYRERPVAILGAGVLGRRIACIWASAGYKVHVRDPSPEQRADCVAYVEENVASYAEKTGKAHGQAKAFEKLEEAVSNAWLIIEAVPEKIQLKIDTFAELDRLAPADCILASNSSSYKSSEMLAKVSEPAKARILNMHYYMPPQVMVVELMTDGFTEPAIFPFLVDCLKEAATIPYVARKESTGFIFNRLWAAVKREVMTILAEEVSVPEEIDSMWTEMFIKGAVTPCKTMDNVGLDTVAFIENHYIVERGLPAEKTVNFLKKEYLDKGKLGSKCSKGGLYPPAETSNGSSTKPKILVLDIGLSAKDPSTKAGQILQVSTDGHVQRVLATAQSLPDGLAVDPASKRMFWTNMGVPGKDDGAVYSANLDGTDIQTVIAPGVVNTPKQLTLDTKSKKVYFCDREGLRVVRCNYDGSGFEVIVQTGDYKRAEDGQDAMKWCVGVTVAPSLGKFYWTQKGPSKGGKGRIFYANITTPAGQSAASRDDAQCILNDLPEPVDLEIDEESRTLYWTDRGEIPFGNSLNRLRLDHFGLPLPSMSDKGYEVISRNLNEAIGLKLDLANDSIYLTDLGGSIYRCNAEGKQRVRLYSDENRALTGITLA
ncbi:uncharacterized protein CDV56_108759 [Aspergillus thermomutatus]|uniref:3-hydroxyacyl-CoA dehydrogenase NAD binding domain-containing protein n=1 Tax=Aspergillus thermomutatus TaxID=41047 RepID=A0A397HHQ6_ASPTH|nr:uncharacterized protein CDV56_108759 [Aspergillus thermomutatus]RHZ62477.1 hypothetical protein CDV56_108759 [Aspergillus thermomutatus]